MTLVACHQPNFLPWLGFFDKLARADVLVLLDDVQYPRQGHGTWENRVRFLVGGGARWVTVPVVRSESGVRTVAETRIDDNQPWRRKSLATIEHNYRRAPRFSEIFPLVEEAIHHDAGHLAAFNEHGLRLMAEAMGVDAGKLVRSSTLGVTDRATDRLVALTKAVGGQAYLSGGGAEGYQEEHKYADAGLELRLQDFRPPVYPQLVDDFTPGLSAIDAMMMLGASETGHLLGGQQAVSAPATDDAGERR